MYNILEKILKFDSEEISDIHNFTGDKKLHCIRICITGNYVFLYLVFYVYLYFLKI